MTFIPTNQELGIPDDATSEERADALEEVVCEHHNLMNGLRATSPSRSEEVILLFLGLDDTDSWRRN